MAENDIYNNKRKYERTLGNIETLDKKPKKESKQKYYCKNKVNLQYFYKLKDYFEMKDLSYVRRCRVFQVMRLVVFVIEKDLKDCHL